MSKALLTGASSGIGLELAKVMAKHGHDLILVARSEKQLQYLAESLKKEFGVQTKVIVMDLGQEGAAQKLFQQVSDEKIDILVNNAGFGDYGLFASSDFKKNHQMMLLNMVTLTELTYLFLPQFLKLAEARILNVASTAAFQPGPLMAVYFATKAYVLSFSEALSEELKKTNVTVTALCPGPTQSGFQDAAKLNESALVKGIKLPSSQVVAEYGYDAMMGGRVVAIHGVQNKMMVQGLRMFPRFTVRKLVHWVQDKR